MIKVFMCVFLQDLMKNIVFLDDLWGIFHDAYENGGELVESSAQVIIDYNLKVCLDLKLIMLCMCLLINVDNLCICIFV